MSNLFPRFQSALRSWAKQQLGQSLMKAVGKLASRVHRDERSGRAGGTPSQPPPKPTQQRKPVANQRGKGTTAKKRADEFNQAVLNKVARGKSDVGQVVEAMLRPGGKPLSSLQSELEAAAKLLEQFGYSVVEPEVSPGRRGSGATPKRPAITKPKPLPAAEDEVHFDEAGEDLDVYRVGSQSYRFNPDDPILTGEMIPVDSSNVHSIGFIWNEDNPIKGTLRVRFLGTNRSASPQSRGGKGPVYHYIGVNPAVFQAFRIAVSKGKFVWDRLRVRGTVSGHQFQYELAVLEKSGYVPRKATRKGADEFFIRRTVKGKNGKTYRSELQDEFVRRVGVNNPPPGVIAGRGAPNRGAPNRGKPNRGKS